MLMAWTGTIFLEIDFIVWISHFEAWRGKIGLGARMFCIEYRVSLAGGTCRFSLHDMFSAFLFSFLTSGFAASHQLLLVCNSKNATFRSFFQGISTSIKSIDIPTSYLYQICLFTYFS